MIRHKNKTQWYKHGDVEHQKLSCWQVSDGALQKHNKIQHNPIMIRHKNKTQWYKHGDVEHQKPVSIHI